MFDGNGARISGMRTSATFPFVALLLGAASCSHTVDVGSNAAGSDAGAQDASTAVDAEAGSPTDGGVPEDGADAAITHYVFLTRAVYDANMGGIMGADERCQASAKAAKLKGVYVAWISDSNTDAKDHVKGNGPWLEPKTEKVLFPDHASLLGFPEAALVRDEYGDPAEDRWWTGTSANGIRNAKNCGDWASNAQFQGGMTGTRNGTTRPGKEWTEDSAFSCVTSDLQKYALICLGQ